MSRGFSFIFFYLYELYFFQEYVKLIEPVVNHEYRGETNMSKKQSKYSKNKNVRITNLKLICGTILFVLFILSIIFIFHYTDLDKGGIEILKNLRNS